MESKYVCTTEKFRIAEHSGDRYVYVVHGVGMGDEGNALLTLQMPEGWRPTMLARTRLIDTLMGVVDGRDLDRVPVGEVFGLVSTVAADIIRQVAQAKAEAAKFQGSMVEAQQKLLAVRRESFITIDVLIRTLLVEALQRVQREGLTSFDPTEYVVARVRDVVDAMEHKPKDMTVLVQEIRETGKAISSCAS